MFDKNAVGIFLGSQGLSIVETASTGKIKNHIYAPYPKDIAAPSGVTVPKDNIFSVFLDNEVEIVAFLQRRIRDSRVNLENTGIVVCVPYRDLIVRFFEIPQIPRKDIDASIGFEIKKYIPFKLEEITYDYQTFSQKNIIEVLFAGIKNDNLQKYNSILTQLKLNVAAIEPSQFSLFRLLKVKKIMSNKESVVVIELERDEGTIAIVDNGIPCFSRDIKIAGGPESAEADMESVSFRIINEVRVSIDYFRRQFLKKGVDRIVVLAKQESKELVSAFNKELGMPVQYKNTDEMFGFKEEYSLDLAKALGASLRINKPSSLIINLGKKQKFALGFLSSYIQILSDIVGEILDIPKAKIIKTLAIASAVLVGIFMLSDLSIKPIGRQLETVSKEIDSALSSDLKGLDAATLEVLHNNLIDKLAVYKKLFVKDILISEKLEVLPNLLPEGVWLEEISFNRSNKYLYLKGLVYRENEKEAVDAPYNCISNLKNSPLFSNKVNNISVKSLKSDIMNTYKVTRFEIDVEIAG
ncbi:MAG: pilus assembly protein PilM [Candidatus Omnitrophica bacterium]|nr:pilus assembly protein PilM [Candidatus Omnitrophota bacterium]MDD5352639.1 pilus assembly protein PilM [Candidatus Omnitrophota bacterium]MDD5550238.1 pilus assembly protein PilM [Candidatus Omnitrophota bacterium]